MGCLMNEVGMIFDTNREIADAHNASLAYGAHVRPIKDYRGIFKKAALRKPFTRLDL